MMYREEDDDTASNELMHEVQQQFLVCKERTNQKFQKLEELIEVAAHKLSLLMSIQDKQQEEGFANSLNWKANTRQNRTLQPPGDIPDSVHHLPNVEKVEGSGWLQDCEQQIAVFGMRNKTQEWKEKLAAVQKNREVFRDLAHASGEIYTGEPIYDEERGEGQECWIEKEFILEALNRGNLDATKPLQSEICSSDRSEELADVSNIQDLQQKKVSPGDTNTDAYNVVQPSREENYVEISVVDPYIFQSIGSSTTNCMTSPRNSLTWSTEDLDMPSVGNNSDEKLELNGHSPFFKEKGIYKGLEERIRLRNTEFGISTKDEEAAYDMNLVGNRYAAYSSDMKLGSTEVVHGDIPKIVGSHKVKEQQNANEEGSSMIPTKMEKIVEAFPCIVTVKDFPTAENSYGLDKKSSNFGKKNVMIIFDPGGNEPAGVIKVVKELFEQDVKLDEGVSIISTSDLLGKSQDMICLKFLTIEQLTKEHSQLRKEVCKVQMLTSVGIQVVGDETDGVISDRVINEINQQYAQSIRADMKMIPTYFVIRYGFHEMDVAMRFEDLEASRRCEAIYIFDPGGELSCLHGVLLDVITGILHFQQFLHDLLKGKDLLISEKESAGAEAFFFFKDT